MIQPFDRTDPARLRPDSPCTAPSPGARPPAVPRGAPQAVALWLPRVHADLTARLSAADGDAGVIARSAQVAAMPGVEFAGAVSSGTHGVLASDTTDPVPFALDRFQVGLRQGPALVALRSGFPVAVPDFGLDNRWPALADRALALGVRGVICHPIRLPGDQTGVLTLYSGEWGFSRVDLVRPGLFAVLAGIVSRVTAAGRKRGGPPSTVPGCRPGAARLLSASDLLTVVELSGDIDLAASSVLRPVLLGLPARRTVLDLSGVGFLSVSGLGLLLEVHRRFSSLGARLHVAAPSAPVRRLIAIAASSPSFSPRLPPEFRPWAE